MQGPSLFAVGEGLDGTTDSTNNATTSQNKHSGHCSDPPEDLEPRLELDQRSSLERPAGSEWFRVR